MARKPLMHNYIYFETLEVGLDRCAVAALALTPGFGCLIDDPPPPTKPRAARPC
jgi:hypothetical protein